MVTLAPGALVEVRSAKGRMRIARILAIPLPASPSHHRYYDSSDKHVLIRRYDSKRGRWSSSCKPVPLSAIGRMFHRDEWPIGPKRKRGRPRGS